MAHVLPLLLHPLPGVDRLEYPAVTWKGNSGQWPASGILAFSRMASLNKLGFHKPFLAVISFFDFVRRP